MIMNTKTIRYAAAVAVSTIAVSTATIDMVAAMTTGTFSDKAMAQEKTGKDVRTVQTAQTAQTAQTTQATQAEHTERTGKVVQTAGRDQLGDFAPKFAELNDDVLFGEVWSRTDRLGLRDRSLVTITALVSMGITDSSLTYHLQTAKKNGITRTEIAEILTHLGFYAGWPKVWAAFRQAKDVWAEDTAETDRHDAARNVETDGKADFQKQMIFPIGEPNTAYAQFFTGNSYLAPVSTEQVKVFNVTFEPGCRNNWHIHRASEGGGQMLIGVAGRGWYQEEGKPAVEILPGTVIHIPANVKHWHGASADSWFAHLAFELDGKDTSNEWLEPVSDVCYNALD